MPKLRGREMYLKLIADQRKWIDEHGGDLAGYLAGYRVHDRTDENVRDIYNADVAELERLERLLGQHPAPRVN